MKKLLILAGSARHCKLVRAAQSLGYYVIVTDYLSDSPAKKIADESWMISTHDIDAVVDACRKNHVDGVLNAYVDACQRPYYTICHELGLPCFIDSREQVFTLTDKSSFKEACIRNGVDTITSYSEEKPEEIEYPVLVKPGYCRGSKGQSVCYCASQLASAIEKAKKMAPDSKTVIEKYITDRKDFVVTYFAVNGEYHCIRTSDRYLGDASLEAGGVSVGTVSSSKYRDFFFEKIDGSVRRLLKDLKIQNGPVFMQGFVDGDTIRFYDPGFRFPESDYDKMIAECTGFDPLKMLAKFAVTGTMRNPYGDIHKMLEEARDRKFILLYPILKPGTITEIEGMERVSQLDYVHSFIQSHSIGEEIGINGNTSQRFCEIDVSAPDTAALRSRIKEVYSILHVRNENREEMLLPCLDPELID